MSLLDLLTCLIEAGMSMHRVIDAAGNKQLCWGLVLGFGRILCKPKAKSQSDRNLLLAKKCSDVGGLANGSVGLPKQMTSSGELSL